MPCKATWYAFEPDPGGRLGGRVVAMPCPADPGWDTGGYCYPHARQLAEAARLGLAVPDPAEHPPSPPAEQASLI